MYLPTLAQVHNLGTLIQFYKDQRSTRDRNEDRDSPHGHMVSRLLSILAIINGNGAAMLQKGRATTIAV